MIQSQRSIPRRIVDPSRIGNQLLKDSQQIITGRNGFQDADRIIVMNDGQLMCDRRRNYDQCHLTKKYEMQTQVTDEN